MSSHSSGAAEDEPALPCVVRGGAVAVRGVSTLPAAAGNVAKPRSAFVICFTCSGAGPPGKDRSCAVSWVMSSTSSSRRSARVDAPYSTKTS
eukprot:5613390-Prymnesium_polylepis.1